MRAARLRRIVEHDLKPLQLSFPLWWVLYAIRKLTAEKGRAVSQKKISLHTQIDKNTVSQLIRALSARALIYRDLAWPFPGYRIRLSPKGESLLAEAERLLDRFELFPPP